MSEAEAEKYLNDHNNPIVRVELPGSKLFLPKSSDEETAYVEKSVTTIKNILKHNRVDRKCARSKAVWLIDTRLSKITKTVGPLLANFGYQNKDGIFLLPEETLFLLETNRLELNCNNKPMSVEEAYNIILNESDCNLLKYKVYKKLVGQGYRLLKKLKSDNSSNSVSNNKRKLSCDASEIKAKVGKNSQEEGGEMAAVFQKLNEQGPKKYEPFYQPESGKAPDYLVFSPNNSHKPQPDFNLYICNNEQSAMENLRFDSNSLDIFAICSDSNIGFYRFSHVNIPVLW